MMRTRRKQSYVIAKAIHDRKFDIPDWMYKLIDVDVIEELVDLIPTNSVLDCYLSNKYAREFFNTVKKKIDMHKLPVYKIYSKDIDYTIILFSVANWKTLRKQLLPEYNYTEKILDIVFHMTFDDTTSKLIPIFLKTMKVRYDSMLKDFASLTKKKENQENRYRFITVIKANESFKLTSMSLELGIPVFFKYGNATDLYEYLSVFIETSWQYPIDDNISRVKISSIANNHIIELMVNIYAYNNKHIMVNAKNMMSAEDFSNHFGGVVGFAPRLALKPEYSNTNSYKIVDFNDLLEIHGHKSHGFPLWLQEQFIENGGNIRTMFNDGELLPEASIIRSMGEVEFIINELDIDDIRFLLYNSSVFVKNVLTRELITNQYIKLAKALFENPINKNLWAVLNTSYTEGTNTLMDFRRVIVDKITVALTLDGLFSNVPESMMYITPGALFVTRNLSKKNIEFIPISKLIPTLLSIISRHDYVKFNRYCNGEEVSLISIVGKDILTKYIIEYNKYGYLGDMSESDCIIMVYKIMNKEY